MARILVALVALGFVVSLAPAETVIMEISSDRDNFNANYPGEWDWNCGGTNNWRFAKFRQEGTYYSDWSYGDLADLGAAIAAGPSVPGNWLEVYYVIYGTSGASTTKAATVETLDSITDWVEGTQHRQPSVTGACDNAADASVTPNVPWVDVATGPVTPQPNGPGFWGLSAAFVNTATTSGWVTGSTDPNLILLDMPLVQHVINDQYNRGLRAFQAGGGGPPDYNENASCAAIGQWGSTGGAKLRLVEVPEPASMLLLGIGGVAVLLRKKR